MIARVSIAFSTLRENLNAGLQVGSRDCPLL